MAAANLVADATDLTFAVRSGRDARVVVTLTNPCDGPVAFRWRLNRPKTYAVRPAVGAVPARGAADVTVTLSARAAAEAGADLDARDHRFVVVSCAVPRGMGADAPREALAALLAGAPEVRKLNFSVAWAPGDATPAAAATAARPPSARPARPPTPDSALAAVGLALGARIEVKWVVKGEGREPDVTTWWTATVDRRSGTAPRGPTRGRLGAAFGLTYAAHPALGYAEPTRARAVFLDGHTLWDPATREMLPWRAAGDDWDESSSSDEDDGGGEGRAAAPPAPAAAPSPRPASPARARSGGAGDAAASLGRVALDDTPSLTMTLPRSGGGVVRPRHKGAAAARRALADELDDLMGPAAKRRKSAGSASGTDDGSSSGSDCDGDSSSDGDCDGDGSSDGDGNGDGAALPAPGGSAPTAATHPPQRLVVQLVNRAGADLATVVVFPHTLVRKVLAKAVELFGATGLLAGGRALERELTMHEAGIESGTKLTVDGVE